MPKIEILQKIADDFKPDTSENILILLRTPDSKSILESQIKERIPNYLAIDILDGYPEDHAKENWSKLCCAEDIELILDFVELNNDAETIYIIDDSNSERAWMIAAGILWYINPKERKDCIYIMASKYKDIPPNCLSIAEVIDLEAGANGKFLLDIEAYLVSQTVLSSQGIITRGNWQLTN